MAKAVDIVKGYFKEWKLIPRGENGSYTTAIPPPLCRDTTGKHYGYPNFLSPKTRKKLYGSPRHTLADGWFAGGMTSNGEVTADVVYAGFGVTAPELGYDDYKDIDVKGKIVLVEGETPNISRNPDSLAMWYKHTCTKPS